LAVEEQFYLVWPVLVFFLRSRTLAIVTAAVFVIEPIVRFLTVGSLLDVVWCRIDGLAIGALIALYVRSRFYSPVQTVRLALLAIVAAGVLLAIDIRSSASSSYALRITEADLAFGALVATAFAATGSKGLSLLRTRTARFIADTSFCVYLIHVPLLDFAKLLGVGAGMGNPFAAAALRAAVAIPLAFGIAALSRVYLEQPFLRLKDRFASGTPRITRGTVRSPAAREA
jgi:peptidoglycan/LPS O-acetylase OafA/YrhL